MYVCMYVCMFSFLLMSMYILYVCMYVYLNVMADRTRMYDVCLYLFGLGLYGARPGVSSSSAAKDGDLNSH